MKELGFWIGFGLVMIVGLGVALGFSLKTKQGLFFILCAFVGGFIAGYSLKDLTAGIRMGIIFAGLAALLDPVMFRNNQRFRQ